MTPTDAARERETHYEIRGKFYWPSAEFSIPADNLCWHIPPAPDRDFRCIRPHGHPGKHQYEWSPTVKDHSHKSDVAS